MSVQMSYRDLISAQVPLLRGRLRGSLWKFGGVAIALLLVALFNLGLPVLHGTSAENGSQWSFEIFGASEFGMNDTPGTIALVLMYICACLTGMIGAVTTWCSDPPRRRWYHWAMPVDRPRHDLARVLVGAMGVILVIVIFMLTTLIGLSIAQHFEAIGELSFAAWAGLFIVPLVIYLLASIAAISSDKPNAVVWTVVAVLNVPMIVFGLIDFEPGSRVFEAILNGKFGISTFMVSGFVPSLTQTFRPDAWNWWLVALIWITVGVSGVAFVTYRYQER